MAGPARTRHRPAPAGLPSQRRPDAAGRDRQGVGAADPGPAAGRADGLADTERVQGPVPHPAQAARRRGRHCLRQPQARGSVRSLRHGDGAARWTQRLYGVAAAGARPAGCREDDDRPGRTHCAPRASPQADDGPLSGAEERRLSRRSPQHIPCGPAGRDPRPLRAGRRRPQRIGEDDPRPRSDARRANCWSRVAPPQSPRQPTHCMATGSAM
jgi:hypothetical protein